MTALLTIAPETYAALEAGSVADYARRLSAWVAQQPELASHVLKGTPAWCEETLRWARTWHVLREDLVARLARLRLLNGDDWLRSAPVLDTLGAMRDQELKVFQVECLHWRVSHD